MINNMYMMLYALSIIKHVWVHCIATVFPLSRPFFSTFAFLWQPGLRCPFVVRSGQEGRAVSFQASQVILGRYFFPDRTPKPLVLPI